MNNFWNLLLTPLQLKTFKYRYEGKELTHIRVNIIYYAIIGAFIIILND